MLVPLQTHHWPDDAEPRAAERRLGHRHLAAVPFDRALDDRESQAKASLAPGGALELHEGFKHAAPVRFRNSRSVIVDEQPVDAGLALERNSNRPPGVTGGVIEKILEDRLHQMHVATDFLGVTLDVGADLEVGPGVPADGLGDGGNQRREVMRVDVERDVGPLEYRVAERRRDEIVDGCDVRLDVIERPVNLLDARGLLRQLDFELHP